MVGWLDGWVGFTMNPPCFPSFSCHSHLFFGATLHFFSGRNQRVKMVIRQE